VKPKRKNAPRKPVSKITDRAKRYRAHAPDVVPPPPKQCGFCGGKRDVIPHHITGNESDGDPQDLMWACRSCNQKVGGWMRKAGIGKLTRQFNPGMARKEIMREYGNAIKVMRGEFEGDIGAAVATIRATPRDIRSAYTSRTWPTRRAIYGPAGRAQGALPF
jgi:hypothetical protein